MSKPENVNNISKTEDDIQLIKKDLESSINLTKFYKTHYTLLFIHSPFAVFFVDPTGIILDCNDKSSTYYMMQKPELMGTSIHNLIAFPMKEFSKEMFLELRSKESIEYEFQYIRKDGEAIEIHRKAYPVKNDEGKIVEILCFDENITNKKRNEELLKLRSRALEVAANSIVITNNRGDVVWVNPAFTELSGYNFDEIVYKNIRILKSGKHDNKFYKNLWDTVRKGKVWHGNITNRRKDGSEWCEEQTITPVMNLENEIEYFISIKQDITERIIAEEEAKIQNEQLMQADKMIALGTLVSGVAHEINNPNNFIMLNTPILKKIWAAVIPILDNYYDEHGDFYAGGKLRYSKIRKSLPEILQGIEDGSERIKKIVEELKNFARKESSETDQKVDVNKVVNAAINLIVNIIKSSTKNFSVSFGENLPPVKGNFQKLEQVVINLLENSCQALQNNSKQISVKTYFEEVDHCVVIEVKDEGVGMDPEIIKEITDPFYTTKRDIGGTGLGLSVSSKIVSAHSGKLKFESVLNEGTAAKILLPAATQKNYEEKNNG
ncbi:MAG: PAS domain S-box protein [Ignavibacteriae bacterium]|nr:PAS domain S-box protein [Ignavibacteriota bacterium]NOH00031.1 PAS domain S-box protein [Ignavibacteriota bacterium]